ncbi:MAG: hypothetical protein WAN61_02035 [Minisyncoccia bacterium]
MYFIFILFFGSLLGIVFMLGRKLLALPSAGISVEEQTQAPFLEEWKYLTVKNIKKHGYKGLVATVRFYVLGTNFLKNKLGQVKTKIKNLRGKKLNEMEKREVSGFLKMISEYKQKIREIKHQIKEEENL